MDTMTQEKNIEQLKSRVNNFINVVNNIEIENAAAIRSKQSLERTINQLAEQNKDSKEALDIATNAISILRQVSDEAVSKAYTFLESSLNSALSRMFVNTTRKIKIKEYVRNKQYPQLELVLYVGPNKTRSLKTDSGHGVAQIVSLLSILSLIVITGSRRILVMDEIISGLSVHNRRIVSDILWSFTEIGFQFIVNDHGFIPEGSHVYHLQMDNDVSHVANDYIATTGVYLQGDGNKEYDYKDKVSTEQNTETEIDESDMTGELIEPTEITEQTAETVEPTAIDLNGTDVISI